LLAVHVNSVDPPCAIVRVMFVTISVGSTPVHPPFGHPAAAPETVFGADRTAGFVVKVTFPFLIAPLGIVVGAVVTC
jgi:hypothetical protein